jgi:hypothetical protein
MPDESGYPTEKEIARLKECAGSIVDYAGIDIEGLIETLLEVWWHPDYVKRNGRYLELHTSGWSGNEEIVSVLQESMFWLMCWYKTERGGHYYFELLKD